MRRSDGKFMIIQELHRPCALQPTTTTTYLLLILLQFLLSEPTAPASFHIICCWRRLYKCKLNKSYYLIARILWRFLSITCIYVQSSVYVRSECLACLLARLTACCWWCSAGPLILRCSIYNDLRLGSLLWPRDSGINVKLLISTWDIFINYLSYCAQLE